ncbi:ATPase [Agaricicola taiwanensis]|uniref:histidine kinase n=1 Tax=Agaricicola taiwanensis TaxID=591372 RepID=A0A8J2VNB7_9RHOB|nr:ATPase [Agaricicola taiwanensis]
MGLSGKLLGLTILFVMVAEILIYVPAIANYRERWLEDRLGRARSVALVLEAAPAEMVSPALTRELLHSVGAKAVALKLSGARKLLAISDTPEEASELVDLRESRFWTAIPEALGTLLAPPGRTIRVVGAADRGEFVEAVLEESALKAAMLNFSVNLLLVSLLITAITGAMLYVYLDRMIVRPVRHLTGSMTRFRSDPEGEGIAESSDRDDEIGIAERELAALQHQLRGQLQSKARLAALGLAVSKINHDLRNLLASAQLLSERLEDSSDPMVRRVAPKLLSTIERAVDYCRSVLAYGRAQERTPERARVLLSDVVDDAEEAVTLGRPSGIAWISAIERGLEIDADPDQLFRVLVNLTGNAVQALESKGDLDPARDQIRISGRREGGLVIIEVSDTGPGLSEKARQHLFEAFHGSTRQGGTGLGLVISHEIIRAHGGEIRLVEGTLGATFRIVIPDRPLDLAAHARERKRART